MTRSSLLKNLLCMILMVILSLGVLEVILRTTHLLGARISWSDPDPVIGWRFVPNGKFWSDYENDHPIEWRTNQHGWRSPERPVEKSPGTYRIAMIGDSYVEAVQVEHTSTFHHLLETHYKESNQKQKVEVFNFGRSGFTQTEEHLILESDVFKFSPDHVVLFFFPVNDITDISTETALSKMRPFFSVNQNDQLQLDTRFNQTREFKLKSLISPLKQRSALISLITERFVVLQRMRRAKETGFIEQVEQKKLKGYLSLATLNPDPQYVKNYALNKRIILEIVKKCKERDIDFTLVAIDIPAYVPEVEKMYQTIDGSFNANFFEYDLEKFAEWHDIDYISLQSIFREEHQKTGETFHWNYRSDEGPMGIYEYGSHPGHWDYAGHKLVAKILHRELKGE